ncbi:MAG: DUF2341 domain-containing protein [Candidatus Kariarchaeaceae archaeon]|jgi:hypothetical protein
MFHRGGKVVGNHQNYVKFVFALMIIGSICTVNLGFVYAADPWWDSQWSYRKSITVDNSQVDGDLADFPVLVDIIDSDLSSKALSNGDDIVFTDSAAIKLSHEIESYENSTGHLVAWVKVANLSSSTDTVLYLYYGNSGASNQENVSDVWSSNYTMVHHLAETSGTHIDSTLRDNNGTTGGDVNQSAVGIVNGAVEFEGVNGYVQVPHSSDISGFTDSFTASVWMRIDNSTNDQQIFAKYNTTLPLRGWYVRYRDWPTQISIALVASSNGSASEQWHTIFTPQNGSWHHITVVWETGTVPSFYVNGSQTPTVGTNTLVDIYDNPGTDLYFGRYITPGFSFDGVLDEARISKTARSADWIDAEFNNQDDPQSFYTVGSEETGDIFYITATAGSGGSISPQGLVSVEDGTNKTFYITHDDGYEISEILVDSAPQGVITYYTFTNVVANHTIEAQFAVATPPVISKDKSSYSKENTVTITVTGGTANKPVMLQINNPSGGKIWADQDTFAVDGSYIHQFKIPTSWSYGTYTIHVRDVEAGTTKSASLNIPQPGSGGGPPPPPPPPPSNKKPVSKAGPDQNALVDRIIYFNGSGSTDSDGSIASYLWIFGDGSTKTGVSTSHSYDEVGEYTVELIVIDNTGGADSDYANVTVQALPLEPEAGTDEGVASDETNYVVDSIAETSTKIKLNTTNQVTVSLLQYPENPYPGVALPENSLPTVVDVFISNPDGVSWPIYVERHYSDADIEGLDESMLVLYYYDDGAWHICSETGVLVDLNIVWANMYESEVHGSPTLIAPRPSTAAFEVSDLIISPSIVEPGDDIEISVKVTNIGGDSGNYTIILTVEGVTEDSETVSLDGETSTQVTFSVTKTADGTYSVEVNGLSGDFIVYTPEPAEFELSGFDLSGTHVQPGELIEGTVIVSNLGEVSGSYSIEVELDGVIVDLQMVTLDGGESTTVTFIISSDDEGTHSVQLESQIKSFIVSLPPAPAEMVVSGLSLSKSEVEPGEEIEGSVTIENVGEESGTYSLAASLDGSLIHEEVLSLNGGQSTTITFDVSSDEPGSHTVQVEDLSQSFNITEPESGSIWLLVDLVIIAAVILVIYYARQKKWI